MTFQKSPRLDTPAICRIIDNWHTDVTFIETPPLAPVLTPRTLPSSGETPCGGSNVAATRRSPTTGLLDKLTAEHSFETGFPRSRWGVGPRKEKWEKAVAEIHPSFIRSCARLRVANEGSSSILVYGAHFELTEKESDALLAFLFAHLAKPEFTVRWHWKLGDVAFWDNRLSTHYATLDYLPEIRVMHRAAILGDRPV
jgi:taurine dioxygenase